MVTLAGCSWIKTEGKADVTVCLDQEPYPSNNDLLNTYYVLGTIGDDVTGSHQFQQYCEISDIGSGTPERLGNLASITRRVIGTFEIRSDCSQNPGLGSHAR